MTRSKLPLLLRTHKGLTDGAISTGYAGTRAEVMALIKSQPSGTRFLVYITNAAVDVKGDDLENSSLACSVQVSRAAMLCATYECMRDTLETRGALIPCSVYEARNYRAFYLF